MVLGLFLAQEVKANVMYVYGKIDSVSGLNPYLKVGDAVYFKINYAASGGAVSRASVTVNDSVLNFIRTNDTSVVFVDENPADGTVQWTLSTGNTGNSIDVASNTPGGVIPCIDSFDLGRSFHIDAGGGVSANGTVTAKPLTRTGM